MKVQPRQQILEMWEATARSSFHEGKWAWGGRDEANSISDAEQLLCLMLPAAELPAFRLDSPDETAEDVLDALLLLGDAVETPKLLVRVITDYLRNYTDESGAPTFAGGSYFQCDEPANDMTAEQRRLDVVDSFSMSVTLMLATLGFVKVFRGSVRRAELRQEVDELEALASARLSAAMVGLLRSFTVSVFDPNSAPGRALCRMANQNGWPDRRIVDGLQRALREVKISLRDVTIGSGRATDLDNPNRLFECGWSWGIVQDAPDIKTVESIGPQRRGLAPATPYLYFTVIALDGIPDLFSERTRVLGLLNDEQQRLARALQIRWDLTQSYWATIASFGPGRWPLEDIPWKTTAGRESDYFSLLVTSMVVNDLMRRRATDTDLGRLGGILEELATRSKITRRPVLNDPAVEMHVPGIRMGLSGAEELGGPRLSWVVSDFAPLLLKRTVQVAGLAKSTELRGQLVALANGVWDHLLTRRLRSGLPGDLWDQPGGAFHVDDRYELPSWYFTERVIECLVSASKVVGSQPLRSERLTDIAADLLTEADHLFDQELLGGSAQAGPSMRTSLQRIRANLNRARTVLHTRPGTAIVLATEVLRDLDQLTVARQDVGGVT